MTIRKNFMWFYEFVFFFQIEIFNIPWEDDMADLTKEVNIHIIFRIISFLLQVIFQISKDASYVILKVKIHRFSWKCRENTDKELNLKNRLWTTWWSMTTLHGETTAEILSSQGVKKNYVKK